MHRTERRNPKFLADLKETIIRLHSWGPCPTNFPQPAKEGLATSCLGYSDNLYILGALVSL